MARGGVRKGAGRKAGAVTVKTREIANKVAADGGRQMLEIMVENARHLFNLALEAEQALAEMTPDKIAGLEPEEQFNVILAEVKKAAGLRMLAQECASEAAPFMHAKISPIDPGQRREDVVPLAERLQAYAREEAIEQSAGKVVELKKKAKRK